MLIAAVFLFVGRHFWVDRLNPWVLRFGYGFGIRWYGLAYLAGILLAGWILSRWIRQGRLPVQKQDVSVFLLYAGMGIVMGGRLGYCLFYNLQEVIHDPLEIFRVWHGGMASHGGILGLILAVWIFARTRRVHFLAMLDAAAVTGPLGIALGRLANFVNGELWGRPSRVPWAVIFPQAPLVNGVEVPRHPSQLYAAGIEGILVFLLAQWAYARSRRPGLTTATVCVAYGVGRFIDEFWRQPDVGQPVYWGWMSKGQLLTLPMILIGILWLLYCRRSALPSVKDGFPAHSVPIRAEADAAANAPSQQGVCR